MNRINPGSSCFILVVLLCMAIGGCATGGRLDKNKFSSTVDRYLARPDHKALVMNLSTYMTTAVWNSPTLEQAIAKAMKSCKEEESGGQCELVFANDDRRYDYSAHYSGGGDPFGQAIGVFAAIAGAVGGDQNLSNQGLSLFNQSQGSYASSTPPSVVIPPRLASAPSAGSNSPSTSNRDPSAIVNRCTEIARSRFPIRPNRGQGDSGKQTACLNYCAYTITGNKQFLDDYKAAQASANSVCSGSVGNNCNDIRPIEQCKYQ